MAALMQGYIKRRDLPRAAQLARNIGIVSMPLPRTSLNSAAMDSASGVTGAMPGNAWTIEILIHGCDTGKLNHLEPIPSAGSFRVKCLDTHSCTTDLIHEARGMG